MLFLNSFINRINHTFWLFLPTAEAEGSYLERLFSLLWRSVCDFIADLSHTAEKVHQWLHLTVLP